MCRLSRAIADQNDAPPDLRVAWVAAEQHGVVSNRQLNACGLDNDAIMRRVRSGRVHRVHRGVYAVGHDALSLQGRFMAAVLACGRAAVLSHLAAAAHWGFVAWEERQPEVTVAGACARRVIGVRVHRSRALDRRDVVRHDAVPVTAPARTLLDLAAVLPERGLRHAARRAQAEHRVSTRQLRELVERSNGHRGVAALRAVAVGGPAPTRSELEDVLLDLLDAAGIQRPEINAPLRFGGRTIVPDYLWRDRRLVIEADGATWHDNPLTREHDVDKQAILEANGFRILRITWRQAVRSPQQTLDRVRAALASP